MLLEFFKNEFKWDDVQLINFLAECNYNEDTFLSAIYEYLCVANYDRTKSAYEFKAYMDEAKKFYDDNRVRFFKDDFCYNWDETYLNDLIIKSDYDKVKFMSSINKHLDIHNKVESSFKFYIAYASDYFDWKMIEEGAVLENNYNYYYIKKIVDGYVLYKYLTKLDGQSGRSWTSIKNFIKNSKRIKKVVKKYEDGLKYVFNWGNEEWEEVK